jgi:hypothetical protein
MSDKRGLYKKFRVERTDGQSAGGEKHYGCSYFVLDLDHDPAAIPALLAYADACELRYPQLADDLRACFEAGEDDSKEFVREFETRVDRGNQCPS